MGTFFGDKAAAAVLMALVCTASCADHTTSTTLTTAGGTAATAPPAAAGEPNVFRDTASGFVTASARWSARVTRDGGIELAARGAGTAMLQLDTIAIARDVSAPVSSATVSSRSDVVRIERAEATELVRRIERGVEQAWRFDDEPSGTSALEVVVAVEGATFVGSDDEGLRFIDEQNGVRFRYGFATWIDATGQQTQVPTRGADGIITITVPEVVLASSQFPAVLDPTIEVETELDPTSIYSPATEAQHGAFASSDGVDALVVWQDQRNNPFEVFGTGVASDGTAYQRANVPLADSGMFDLRTAYLETDGNGDRHFVLVASNLFEIFTAPITMTATGEISAGPRKPIYTPVPGVFSGVAAVASSANGHYLVLFHSGNVGGNTAFAQVFDFAHDPLTSAQTLYAIDADVGFPAGVAFLSTSYVVVNRNNNASGLVARVISPVTAQQTSSFSVSPQANEPTNPTIAYNGTSALVAWESGGDVSARRVIETGPQLAEFVVSNNAGAQFRPHAIAGDMTANDHFVIWLSDENLEGELIGGAVSSGNVTTQFASGSVVFRPHGARVGGAPLIVYDDGDGEIDETTDVFSRDFTANWVAPRRLTEEANRQRDASVDSIAGGSGLVAWTDTRNDNLNTDVFAIVVDDSGAPSSSLITVSTDAEPEHDTDVATGAGESVVVWRRGDDAAGAGVTTDIMAALIDDTGAVLDSMQLATGRVNLFPRIIRDGSSYLVTWQTGDFSCESFCQFFEGEPTMATLTTTGGTIAMGATTQAGEPGLNPMLARSPNGAVLWVWERAGDIHAARVTAGSVGTTLTISQGPKRQSRAAVAMDDDVALIVFEDDRNGGSQIFAATLAAVDDAVVDLGSISADIEARGPEVVDADDGYSFLVVFDGSAFGAPEQVWGGWVKKSGVKADPIPRQLTQNTLGASRRPDITPLGAGRMVIGFDAISSERAERAHTAVVDSGQFDGTICDIPDQCASRFCADGICCSEPCTGECRQCGDGGVCALVVNQEDDSCFGDQSCSEDGECLRADGQTCDGDDPASCASGFCVDGVCCESECAGECDKCGGETAGQCRPNACGNFSCHPDKTCRETCGESRHCLDGFQCVDGDCVTPPPIVVEDTGCACQVVGARQRQTSPWWLLLGLLVFRRRVFVRRKTRQT